MTTRPQCRSFSIALKSELRTGPALARVAGPKNAIADWEQPMVLAYLAYGYADPNGDRSIDVFLREQRGQLKAAEVDALEALASSAWPSLFEVQKVETDVGIHFTDLVSGEEIFVREKAATHHLKTFDVMLAWLVYLVDHYELTGAGVMVPRVHLDVVRKALAKDLRRLRKSSDAPDRLLLREAAVAAQRAMREAIENWQPPRMVTTDGDDVMFCEALFDVTDLAVARVRLAARDDLDPDDDGFVWVDRRRGKQFGGGPLHLGSLKFQGDRLVLETTSRERLERGKRLLLRVLAGVVRHRLDAIKDLDVAMEEFSARPEREPKDEIPEDIQAQIIGPMMQKHLESWIDQRLPALNGKTPRQVATTRAGREKVLTMLKDQQNSMQDQPGGDMVDFAVVYRELGLTEPRSRVR